jgi:hypothetical protein
MGCHVAMIADRALVRVVDAGDNHGEKAMVV